MRLAIMIFALLLSISAAKADVVYEWRAFSGGGGFTGTLVVTDAALVAGHASWTETNFGQARSPVPGSPIISISFDAPGYRGVQPRFDVSHNFVSDDDVTGDDYRIELTSISDSGLQGSIVAENANVGVILAGDSSLWTFSQAESDFGPCDTRGACAGDTGRWIQLSGPSAVPTPGTLILIAAAGLALFRRKRRAL